VSPLTSANDTTSAPFHQQFFRGDDMPRRNLYATAASCAIALATACSAANANDDTLPAISPQTEPIKLFDGKSFDTCYTWLKDTKRADPRHVFTVADGMIHISGDGYGGLVTKDRYRDYHCVLEYKWGEKTWPERVDAARDSGLLIHSNGADGSYAGNWMPSIEVQIIEGGVGDFILVNGKDDAGKPVPISVTSTVGRDRDDEVVWKADGQRETFDAKNRHRINWFGRDADWKDERGFRGAHDVESPHGQWTRIDVLAEKDKIEVFVNGVKVNEGLDVMPAAGRLQLQTELAEIFCRRWELWPIGQGPKPAPAQP
jgi:hypothetical protein